MYIWKVNSLVSDFRNDKVTERESMKYLVFLGVMYALGNDPVFTLGLEYTYLDAITTLIVVVATIVGTIYCYTINRSGDNRDFVHRFICLSIPVSIRLIVVGGILALVYGVSAEFLSDTDYIEPLGDTYKTDIESVVIYLFVEIIFFWYIGYLLKKISKATN